MAREIISVPAESALFEKSRGGFKEYGYAPAVRAGGLLFISGQIGRRADGTFADNLIEQIELAFERTLEIMRWVGLTKDDFVEVYSYHVGLGENLDVFTEVKNRYLSPNFPAWTALGVAALALPEMMIEIRSIAAFRD